MARLANFTVKLDIPDGISPEREDDYVDALNELALTQHIEEAVKARLKKRVKMKGTLVTVED